MTRSRGKVTASGTFTDIATGYRLRYKSAFSVFVDYAEGTETYTGLEIKITDEAGKVVARNIGRWVWGEEGLKSGSGHQDFTGLICPFFPQG